MGNPQWKPSLNPSSPSTLNSRIQANIAAITLVKDLDGAPATPSQQSVLAQYSGWGGLSAVFDERNAKYESYRAQLQTLLTEEEYKSARRSVINAHYTHPEYVQAVWSALESYGFDGGRVLEPGCGVGNFIGLAPQGAHMTGVELDPLSASIAQALYPHAHIRNEGYETTPTPELFDAAVGNVPFGDIKLYDPAGNPGNHSIHNHFIVKALSQTKPGGVVAVLTSRYTLDAANPAARRDMYSRADLVSAVRLPTGAHSRIAHTEAVTDVLVFRVRKDGEAPRPFDWEHAPTMDIDGDSVRVNEFYQANPDHVLGSLRVGHGMYNSRQLQVEAHTVEALDLPRSVGRDLTQLMESDIERAKALGLEFSPQEVAALPAVARAPRTSQVGSLRSVDADTFEVLTDIGWDTLDVPKSQRRELSALLGLRDGARALIEAEAASASDTPQLDQLRRQLRSSYQSYVDQYGPINRMTRTARLSANGEERITVRRPPVMRTFDKDPFAPLAKAIEIYDADADIAQPAPIQSTRQIFAKYTPKGADTAEDALQMCIEQRGKIDLDYIGYLLGEDNADTVRQRLGTQIFDLPEGGYATRAEYLSGNVRRKLAAATAASANQDKFSANIEALNEVMPADLTPMEISAEPGAAWISTKIHANFIYHLVRQYGVEVAHDPINGWQFKGTSGYGVAQTSTWGTPRMTATQIFQNLCNNAPIRVFDEDSETGRQILNPVATEAAQGKAEQIREEFIRWLWDDPDRAANLLKVYNERFNSHVSRTYDEQGRALRLPGLAKTFQLHDHQRTAVARMIAEPTTGLFHEVGAGKTLEMVAGVMEQKRLGLIQKPMVIVPNHMLAQFEREWLQAYPQAKILAADVADITNRSGRGDFMARVTTSDWDAVICTQKAFERIPVESDTLQTYMSSQIEDLERWLETSDDAERYSVSRAEKALQRMRTNLEKRLEAVRNRSDAGLTFEKLGVDYLLVDEAHHYKNLSAQTRTQGIISATSSQRAQDLDMKLGYLRRTYGQRCATFATATPIANTMGEMWVMTHYLRPDLLEEAGLDTFDQWAKAFTEITSSVEATPSGKLEVRQRPARFQNLPELMQIWSAFGDVKTRDDLNLPVPDLKIDENGKRAAEVVKVDAGVAIDQFQERVLQRAELIQNRLVEPHIDNWLTLANDGKAMATDYRLISEKSRQRALDGVDVPLDFQKVDAAADRIAAIYDQYKDAEYLDELGQPSSTKGALQIVFLDQGTPGKRDKWNLYDELRDQLIQRGVPDEKIAYTHDASTTVEKDQLFARARTGAISVLIGSTEKMGTGANMQARAVALHHLNAPWRPADLAQREGRIIRQGNQNSEVQILRYVTERSFDTYMWQTLERKAAFINQIMRGTYSAREAEDLSPEQASYAQVKAIASGNPLLLEEAGIQNQLRTYQRRSQAWKSNQQILARQVSDWQSTVRNLERTIQAYEEAAATISPTAAEKFTASLNGVTYVKRAELSKALSEKLVPLVRDYAYLYQSPHLHTFTSPGLREVKLSIGTTPVLVGLAAKKANSDGAALAFALPHPSRAHMLLDADDVLVIAVKDIATGSHTIATRLENYVQSVHRKLEHYRTMVADKHAEIERGRIELAADNPWQSKLKDSQEQLSAIRSKIASMKVEEHRDAKRTASGADNIDQVRRVGMSTMNFGAPTKPGAAVPTHSSPPNQTQRFERNAGNGLRP